MVHAGGPDATGAGRAGVVGRDHAGVRAAAARGDRPGGRGAERGHPDRRLQDGQGPAGRVRDGRALPDEVLRAGAVAAARSGAAPAPVGVSGQRRGPHLRPGRDGSAGRGAEGAGAVGGDPAGDGVGRLAAQARPALLLV